MRTEFPDGPETPLLGGDVTEGVVRVGDTVRRPASPVSDAVAAVLRHLESVGFAGAPRMLGRDARSRDVLSFVEGEVAGRPWPGWVGEHGRGASVARLLRAYHDAVSPLGLPDWLNAVPGPPAAELPDPVDRPELVGHRDVTPENVVFRGRRAAALIDFDLLGPVSRAADVANLLLWWAGWVAPQDRDPAFVGVDPAVRGRRLVDAYGLAAPARRAVVPLSVNLAERSWHAMRWRARHLGGGWARMWDDGVGERITRREHWLRANAAALDDALGG